MIIVKLERCMLNFMLKKNLLKKVSSAVLAICFLFCLNLVCLAENPDAEENPVENEFGISTSEESETEPQDYNHENEPKRDFTEAGPFNGVSIEYLVRTISEEANRALKNGKDINDVNESVDKQEIENCKDEVTMSDGGVYSFGSSESNEYENSQNELNDKESTKNYFKARTPKISEFVLNSQSKADVYSEEDVPPLYSEEENE